MYLDLLHCLAVYNYTHLLTQLKIGNLRVFLPLLVDGELLGPDGVRLADPPGGRNKLLPTIIS